jgi:hypothetical protein
MHSASDSTKSPTESSPSRGFSHDAARHPELYGPTHVTILPTYRCTAACAQCCFESSPHLSGQIPIERILAYIDEAAASFPTLKLVVFSGGECFLLREDLDKAISRVTQHGLMSRCVTNGYWAASLRAAESRVAALKQAGLKEINFSTGVDHQRFVPFDRIAMGAVATAAAGIRTIIAIEGYKESKFTLDTALQHPLIMEFLESSPARGNLSFFSNIWIPFKSDAAISQDPSLNRLSSKNVSSEGCDNVLENLVITPHERVSSCCGLTFEHIPEMKLGTAREQSLRELYFNQFDDFIKIWLRVEGPERILQFAASKNPRIAFSAEFTHPCQSCVEIFRNPEVRDALRDSYQEKVHDVIFRYKMMLNLRDRSRPGRTPDPGSPRVGFGA